MSSQAKFGAGTLVKRGDGGAPETFTAVAEIRGTIKFNGMESDSIEVTTHNSLVSSKFKEKIPGLIDPGDLEMDINYVASEASHIALRSDWQAQTKINWQLLAPDGALTSFAGYVMSMPIEYPLDDSITASIKIMITGPPTFS